MDAPARSGVMGLPADARPREKLLHRGASSLSDTELVALLLRTGVRGKDVMQLAAEVLGQLGGVAGLLHASPQALGP
jgi:DNA repair protein RadC